MPCYRDGYAFIAALDLGIRHDHSALVVVAAKPGSDKCQVASCQSWKPGADGRVNLMSIEGAVLEVWRRYRPIEIRFDPWQAALMAQRLEKQGVNMREIPFVPENLNAFAKSLLEGFRNHRVELFPDPELIRDLERLSIVERNWGYKLESTSDKEGHSDRRNCLGDDPAVWPGNNRRAACSCIGAGRNGGRHYRPPHSGPRHDDEVLKQWSTSMWIFDLK